MAISNLVRCVQYVTMYSPRTNLNISLTYSCTEEIRTCECVALSDREGTLATLIGGSQEGIKLKYRRSCNSPKAKA